MKILAMEKDVLRAAGDRMRPYLQAEALRAWELYQAGVFREMYFTEDSNHNAVIIMECRDAGEALETLETLPLVKEGLIKFEVFALEPYSGFARLFAD